MRLTIRGQRYRPGEKSNAYLSRLFLKWLFVRNSVTVLMASVLDEKLFYGPLGCSLFLFIYSYFVERIKWEDSQIRSVPRCFSIDSPVMLYSVLRKYNNQSQAQGPIYQLFNLFFIWGTSPT